MRIGDRTRQWWGRPRGDLVAAVQVRPRRLSLLAVRSDPLRVVAAARCALAPGDVRGTQVRLVGAVADAMTGLRVATHLPAGTGVVGLLEAMPIDPLAPDEPAVSRRERAALTRAAKEAGLRPLGVLTTTEARARYAALPPVLPGRLTLPDGPLLVTAAVAGLEGPAALVVAERDDLTAQPWYVEAVGGAAWA